MGRGRLRGGGVDDGEFLGLVMVLGSVSILVLVGTSHAEVFV